MVHWCYASCTEQKLIIHSLFIIVSSFSFSKLQLQGSILCCPLYIWLSCLALSFFVRQYMFYWCFSCFIAPKLIIHSLFIIFSSLSFSPMLQMATTRIYAILLTIDLTLFCLTLSFFVRQYVLIFFFRFESSLLMFYILYCSKANHSQPFCAKFSRMSSSLMLQTTRTRTCSPPSTIDLTLTLSCLTLWYTS